MATNIGRGQRWKGKKLKDPIKVPTIIDLFGGAKNSLDAILNNGAFLGSGEAAVNVNGKKFESTQNFLNDIVELFDSSGTSLGSWVVEGSYELKDQSGNGTGIFATTLGKRFFPLSEIVECMEQIQLATANTSVPLYTLEDGTPIDFSKFFVDTVEFDVKNKFGSVKFYNKLLGQFLTHGLDDRITGEWLANGWSSVDAGGGRFSTSCGGKYFKGIALGECDGGPLGIKWCEIQEPLPIVDPCAVVTGLLAVDDFYEGVAGFPIAMDITANDQGGLLGIQSVGIYDQDESIVQGVPVYATSGTINIYTADGLTFIGTVEASNPSTFTPSIEGVAVFDYQISDGVNTSVATVTITVEVGAGVPLVQVYVPNDGAGGPAVDDVDFYVNGINADGSDANLSNLFELSFTGQGSAGFFNYFMTFDPNNPNADLVAFESAMGLMGGTFTWLGNGTLSYTGGIKNVSCNPLYDGDIAIEAILYDGGTPSAPYTGPDNIILREFDAEMLWLYVGNSPVEWVMRLQDGQAYTDLMAPVTVSHSGTTFGDKADIFDDWVTGTAVFGDAQTVPLTLIHYQQNGWYDGYYNTSAWSGLAGDLLPTTNAPSYSVVNNGEFSLVPYATVNITNQAGTLVNDCLMARSTPYDNDPIVNTLVELYNDPNYATPLPHSNSTTLATLPVGGLIASLSGSCADVTTMLHKFDTTGDFSIRIVSTLSSGKQFDSVNKVTVKAR